MVYLGVSLLVFAVYFVILAASATKGNEKGPAFVFLFIAAAMVAGGASSCIADDRSRYDTPDCNSTIVYKEAETR